MQSKRQNDIIKSAIDINKVKQKEYKLPEVIPIVLYTGRKKWNANKYIKESQEKLKGYKGIEFAKYNLVDVNDYDENLLLKEESFLSKAMLIEKTRHTNNLKGNLEKIIDNMNKKEGTYNEEQKRVLATIIQLGLKTKIGEENVYELLNKLKLGGEGNMLALLDMIEEENRMLIAKGMKKGKVIGIEEGMKRQQEKIVKKMLEEKVEIELIEKITGLTKEEIEKIKNN